MNKHSFLLLSFCLLTTLSVTIAASDFNLYNDTDLYLHIIWKSNGLGLEGRQGDFILRPWSSCVGCISTYDGNCVHILSIESLDKKYSIRSKPFCKSARIVISFKKNMPIQQYKMPRKNSKKLSVEIIPFQDESL